MRKSIFSSVFFVLVVCMCMCFVLADDPTPTVNQSDETAGDSKGTAPYAVSEDKELKGTHVELKTPAPVEQPIETANKNKGIAETPAVSESKEPEGTKDTNVESNAPAPVEQAVNTVNAEGESKSTATVYAVNEDVELGDNNLEIEAPSVRDPFQPYNRGVFVFNDKAYYYVIRPVYKGYNKVVPEKARLSVRNFFSNIRMPGRFLNCLFQGKINGAATELARFVINSTLGLGGLFDPAKSLLHLDKQNEDFGQTLAKANMGPGFYIEWPFLGSSNVRDTIGYIGDLAMDPLSILSFIINPLIAGGTSGYNTFNDISVDGGDTYESVTKSAVDPYIALQDAYQQNRIKKIKE